MVSFLERVGSLATAGLDRLLPRREISLHSLTLSPTSPLCSPKLSPAIARSKTLLPCLPQPVPSFAHWLWKPAGAAGLQLSGKSLAGWPLNSFSTLDPGCKTSVSPVHSESVATNDREKKRAFVERVPDWYSKWIQESGREGWPLVGSRKWRSEIDCSREARNEWGHP